MQKADVKRLAYFALGALALFYLIPLALRFLPLETQANGYALLLTLVNTVYFIIVGWQSNYLSKYGIVAPGLGVLLYLIAELLLYRAFFGTMEANYLEAAYLVYFLKKFMMRRKQKEEGQHNKPFPKGVGRK